VSIAGHADCYAAQPGFVGERPHFVDRERCVQ
jgi:hypothetical protein